MPKHLGIGSLLNVLHNLGLQGFDELPVGGRRHQGGVLAGQITALDHHIKILAAAPKTLSSNLRCSDRVLSKMAWLNSLLATMSI